MAVPYQTRAAKGFLILSIFFFLFIIPVERVAARETSLVGQAFHDNSHWGESR